MCREIWNQMKAALSSKIGDVHTRIMKKNYEEVPKWWFHVILVAMLALSIFTCEGFGHQLQLKYWVVLLAGGWLFSLHFLLLSSLPPQISNPYWDSSQAKAKIDSISYYLLNQYIDINVVGGTSPLPNEANVPVTISGVLLPDASDWITMISPSDSSVDASLMNGFYYVQTGYLSSLPLPSHYPIKGQYLKNDPSYLSCKQKCAN